MTRVVKGGKGWRGWHWHWRWRWRGVRWRWQWEGVRVARGSRVGGAMARGGGGVGWGDGLVALSPCVLYVVRCGGRGQWLGGYLWWATVARWAVEGRRDPTKPKRSFKSMYFKEAKD
ncbi:hypothetical protein RIF29_35899 [Crotalaria pallida]|uniref:Uncharacterized protein n=1 Tax=Crotalaria pallida TaxID=3830 RepID=A0AAN9EAT2_CROPI